MHGFRRALHTHGQHLSLRTRLAQPLTDRSRALTSLHPSSTPRQRSLSTEHKQAQPMSQQAGHTLEEGLLAVPASHEPTLDTALLPHGPKQHSACRRGWCWRAATATTLATAAALLLVLNLHSTGQSRDDHVNPRSSHPVHSYQCPQGLDPNPDLKFFIVGDWGRQGNPNQLSALHIMQDIASCLPPHFIISTGDNYYPSGLSHPSDPFIKESFTDVYHDQRLQVPWYSVLGNHDYGDSFKGSWKDCPKPEALSECGPCCISPLWQVPAVNPGLPLHWKLQQRAWVQSFSGGQLDIVFIDTSPFIRSYYKKSWADVTGGIVYQNTSAQEEQIEALLRGSTAPWKVVVGHHPIHSFGEHCSKAPKARPDPAAADGDGDGGGDGGAAGGPLHRDHCADMQWLQPLLVKHGVVAYLCGHDHDLQHIRQLDDPVHYVVSGAGSDIRPNEFDDADTSGLAQHFFADDQGFVAATIAGGTMSLYFYTAGSADVSYSVSFPARH